MAGKYIGDKDRAEFLDHPVVKADEKHTAAGLRGAWGWTPDAFSRDIGVGQHAGRSAALRKGGSMNERKVRHVKQQYQAGEYEIEPRLAAIIDKIIEDLAKQQSDD